MEAAKPLLPSLIMVTALLCAPALADDAEWPLCHGGRRVTCVVDGDTLWNEGVKYRLLDIDAPESSYDKARCGNERQRAAEATQLLQRLLRSGIVSMRQHGQDRYGRNLVTIDTSLGDVSTVLLNAELAVPFGDKRLTRRWCTLGGQ